MSKVFSLLFFSALLSLAHAKTPEDIKIDKREKLREKGNYLRVTECIEVPLGRRLFSEETYVENVEVLFVGPNRGITLLLSEHKGRTAVSASATCNTFVELYEPAFLLGKASEGGNYTFSVPVKSCGTTYYQAVDEVKCELSRIAKYKSCDTWYGPPEHNMAWFKYRGRGKTDNSAVVDGPTTLGSFDGASFGSASYHSSSMGIWAVKKEDRPSVGRYGPNTKWFRTKFECEEPTGATQCHPKLSAGQTSSFTECREGWNPFDCLRGDKIIIYAPDGEIVHVIDDGSTAYEPLFKGTAKQQFTDDIYWKVFGQSGNPFGNIYDTFIPYDNVNELSHVYLSSPFTTDCHILNQGYYWRLEGHTGHHYGVFEIYSSLKYEGPFGWETEDSNGNVIQTNTYNTGGELRMYIETGAGNIDIWSNNAELIRGTDHYLDSKGNSVYVTGEYLDASANYIHAFKPGSDQPPAPLRDPDYSDVSFDPTDFPFRDFGRGK